MWISVSRSAHYLHTVIFRQSIMSHGHCLAVECLLPFKSGQLLNLCYCPAGATLQVYIYSVLFYLLQSHLLFFLLTCILHLSSAQMGSINQKSHVSPSSPDKQGVNAWLPPSQTAMRPWTPLPRAC